MIHSERNRGCFDYGMPPSIGNPGIDNGRAMLRCILLLESLREESPGLRLTCTAISKSSGIPLEQVRGMLNFLVSHKHLLRVSNEEVEVPKGNSLHSDQSHLDSANGVAPVPPK